MEYNSIVFPSLYSINFLCKVVKIDEWDNPSSRYMCSSDGNLTFVEINLFYKGFNIVNLTAYYGPPIIFRRYVNGKNRFPRINHNFS
jgi:hypothetical protein